MLRSRILYSNEYKIPVTWKVTGKMTIFRTTLLENIPKRTQILGVWFFFIFELFGSSEFSKRLFYELILFFTIITFSVLHTFISTRPTTLFSLWFLPACSRTNKISNSSRLKHIPIRSFIVENCYTQVYNRITFYNCCSFSAWHWAFLYRF